MDLAAGRLADCYSVGGSGLGLAIVRRLCLLMGGEIEATSELEVGSRFTVRLPAQQVETPALV